MSAQSDPSIAPAQSTRHKWPEKGNRFFTSDRVPFHFKTERDCKRCGMTKVTRHETQGTRDVHWVEFWRDGDQINSELTPMCDARFEVMA